MPTFTAALAPPSRVYALSMRHGLDIILATGSGSRQHGLSRSQHALESFRYRRWHSRVTLPPCWKNRAQASSALDAWCEQGVVPLSTGNPDHDARGRAFAIPIAWTRASTDRSDLTVTKHALRTHTDSWPRHRRWTDQLSSTAPRFLSCLSRTSQQQFPVYGQVNICEVCLTDDGEAPTLS
ncbi:hypothetical protein BGY98DRAFT_268402 [Russula aff. rugulosa BPL654]|nr:hypothetical protein BGY98DRAFT_268402 [Russula aff. rugulosa BPL654]